MAGAVPGGGVFLEGPIGSRSVTVCTTPGRSPLDVSFLKMESVEIMKQVVKTFSI